MGPVYDFCEFVNACGDTNKVNVASEAQDNAREHFKLKTKTILLNFIYTGGLESPSHINTKVWEKNPNPSIRIMVDAYSFFSGLKYGYIAFRFNPVLKTWFVKSFKPNTDPDPRNLILAAQLQKFKIQS